jgi:cysteine desulfurase
MNTIYLDNAATTPIDKEVIDVIQKSMQDNFGNPSSIHQFGRKAKTAVETARKRIASHFNVTASEIIFTAGGTEADNLILYNAVHNLGVQRVVTTKIEHHAVLHPVDFLQKNSEIEVVYVNVDASGNVDLKHLEEIVSSGNVKTLVSLMYINNEIGNILPIAKVSEICKNHNTLFHSDTVQAIGHYDIDLKVIPIDFITASAHKFHGPKGVGFAYFKKGFGIQPMFHGGDQEMGARSSTENVHSILGMERALEIAVQRIDEDTTELKKLKSYFIEALDKMSSAILFNGFSSDLEKSSYTILNVRFPVNDPFFLFNLDLAGIAVSGGSACQSGSNKGSHVLSEMLHDKEADKTSIRFSFSKYTTKEEIDTTLYKLKELL